MIWLLALLSLSALPPRSSHDQGFAKAGALADAGRYNEAAALADQALAEAAWARQAGQRPPWRAIGQHLYFMRLAGRENEVDGDLKRLSADGPDDYEQSIAMAQALQDMGREKESLPWALKAERLRPRDAEASSKTARALVAAGRNQEAIERLRRAVELHPMDAQLRLQLAELYQTLGRWKDAKSSLAGLRKLDLDLDSAVRVGYARLAQGNAGAALEAMRAAVARYPEDPRALHHLGAVLWAQGRHAEACSYFDKALARLNEAGRNQSDDWIHTKLWHLSCLEKSGHRKEYLADTTSLLAVVVRCSHWWSELLERQARIGDAPEAAATRRTIRLGLKECGTTDHLTTGRLLSALAYIANKEGLREEALDASTQLTELIQHMTFNDIRECEWTANLAQSALSILDDLNEQIVSSKAAVILQKRAHCSQALGNRSLFLSLVRHAVKVGDCSAARRYREEARSIFHEYASDAVRDAEAALNRELEPCERARADGPSIPTEGERHPPISRYKS